MAGHPFLHREERKGGEVELFEGVFDDAPQLQLLLVGQVAFVVRHAKN
jgi:hypothetical protein